MTLPVRILKPLMRAATAALVLVVLLAIGTTSAAAADDLETVAAPAATEPSGDALREAAEPLFAFLLSLVNGDSLGVWTGADVAAFAEARGHVSRFPLEVIATIERRRPQEQEKGRWTDARVRAMWRVELADALDRPMPYSILGYHPGSLRISRQLVLSELILGNKTFYVRNEEQREGRHLSAIMGLRLDSGRVVLDADAFPDFVLGGALDDAWTLGFAVAREGYTQVGLAVSVKRDGGPIFGQFDFVRDRIMKSGSPLGSQLSAYCRGWFNQPESDPPATWVEKR